MGGLGSSYQDGRVEIQLSRWEGWDPVIKMGGLKSSYQDGGWDPVIKMGGSRSSYQDGKVGIQLSRWEGWEPINRFNSATLLCLSQTWIWIFNTICHGLSLCSGSSMIVHFVLQLPMQSVPITSKVASLNTAQARCTSYNVM